MMTFIIVMMTMNGIIDTKQLLQKYLNGIEL